MKKLLTLLAVFGLVVGISGVVGCDSKPTTPKATTPAPAPGGDKADDKAPGAKDDGA